MDYDYDVAFDIIKNEIDYYNKFRINSFGVEHCYDRYKSLFEKEPNKFKELHVLLEDIFPSKCPPIGTGFVGYKILKARKTIFRITEDVAFNKNVPEGLYVSNEYTPALAEIYIPEDAKRSSAFGNKCRCDRCIVKKISVVTDGKLQYIRSASSPLTNDEIAINYVVGEDIFVDNFDNDRWNECSSGIHFFTKLDDALGYTINIMIAEVFSSKTTDEFLSWFKKNKY